MAVLAIYAMIRWDLDDSFDAFQNYVSFAMLISCNSIIIEKQLCEVCGELFFHNSRYLHDIENVL